MFTIVNYSSLCQTNNCVHDHLASITPLMQTLCQGLGVATDHAAATGVASRPTWNWSNWLHQLVVAGHTNCLQLAVAHRDLHRFAVRGIHCAVPFFQARASDLELQGVVSNQHGT